MLFLDGVYVTRFNNFRFVRVEAQTTAELTRLIERISQRVGRHLERRGLLVRDAENAYLEWDGEEASPMDDLAGHAITYRIAVGANRGQKAFTLQTLPAVELQEGELNPVASTAGFTLHAGVAAKAHQRDKNLCDLGQCKDRLDFLVAGQRQHRLLMALGFCQFLDLLLVVFQDLIEAVQLPTQQFQVHLQTARLVSDSALQPAVVEFRPIGLVAGLRLVVKPGAAQQGLQVPAQLLALQAHQLPRTHQVLLQLFLRDRDNGQQIIRIKLCQLRRINTIGLDRLAALPRDTAWRHHVTVIILLRQVPLQREANIRGFIGDLDQVPEEMLADLRQLTDQTLKRRSAAKTVELTDLLAECRPMIIGVIDIQANINYLFGSHDASAFREMMRHHTPL